jgi:hypothetical protein
MEQGHFHAAVSAARRGDRVSAYQLMRQVLQDNPNHMPAWLWMSEFVTDIASQRGCLERALALDPTSQPVRQRLALLRLRDMVAARPANPAAGRVRTPRKLGEYLVAQGIITAEQLEQALRAQQSVRNGGKRRSLGDILIRLGWLTPEKLVSALVLQQQDKLSTAQGQSPERLGEYLVAAGLITTEELAAVLTQQVELHQRGAPMMLGELLVSGGYLTPDALEQVLDQQRDDFLSCFNQ